MKGPRFAKVILVIMEIVGLGIFVWPRGREFFYDQFNRQSANGAALVLSTQLGEVFSELAKLRAEAKLNEAWRVQSGARPQVFKNSLLAGRRLLNTRTRTGQLMLVRLENLDAIVKNGAVVLAPGNIMVGRTMSQSDALLSVELLSNFESVISAQGLKSGARGVVKGTGGGLVFATPPSEPAMVIGETLVSTRDPFVPDNLVLGVVGELGEVQNLERLADVTPFVPLDGLDQVFIAP